MAQSAGIIARTPLPPSNFADIENKHKYSSRSIVLTNRNTFSRTMDKFTEIFPIPRDDPNNPVNALYRFPNFQKPDDSYYRCFVCKFPLAPANSTFEYSDKEHPFQNCTHIFLSNPFSWMQLDHSSPGGKLFCQYCETHVGEYCWLGVQCACGEIQSPGLALVKEIDGDTNVGVEFRRVSEGSVDCDEVFSSQGTSENTSENESSEENDRDDSSDSVIQESSSDDNDVTPPPRSQGAPRKKAASQSQPTIPPKVGKKRKLTGNDHFIVTKPVLETKGSSTNKKLQKHQGI